MWSRLLEEGKNPRSVGAVIVPMATLDTSFSTSTTKGIESLRDHRVPALVVAASYLETPEGPLLKAARGQRRLTGARSFRRERKAEREGRREGRGEGGEEEEAGDRIGEEGKRGRWLNAGHDRKLATSAFTGSAIRFEAIDRDPVLLPGPKLIAS